MVTSPVGLLLSMRVRRKSMMGSGTPSPLASGSRCCSQMNPTEAGS